MTHNLRERLFLAKRWLRDPQEVRFFGKLLKNEKSLTNDELIDLNWQRCKKIVKHAFEKSKFYRKIYQATGFEPGDLKSRRDFENLPTITKKQIRGNLEEIVVDGVTKKELKEVSTGGSTGIPLTIYRPKKDLTLPIAWRAMSWWGVSFAANSGYLYRAIPSARNQKLQQMLLWPTKRCWISALEMNLDSMRDFYEKICHHKTSYLVGYVGALENFARYLRERDYSTPHLKAVWCTASPLTMAMRSELELTFGCKVFNQYGSCEFYWIASDCQFQTGLHVSSDVRHVEVVNCNDDGVGDLLVTDLENDAFPLIRYEIGDRSRLLNDQCKCDLPFPRIDYVLGRTSDQIYADDGSAIPGEYWTTIFDNHTELVDQFKVIQNEDYDVDILVVPSKKLGELPSDKLETELRRLIGSKLSWSITYVDEIPHVGGKIKFVENLAKMPVE